MSSAIPAQLAEDSSQFRKAANSRGRRRRASKAASCEEEGREEAEAAEEDEERVKEDKQPGCFAGKAKKNLLNIG